MTPCWRQFRFSLRTLMAVLVAIALFLPHYPFLERHLSVEHVDDVWGAFFPRSDAYRGEEFDDQLPVFRMFPPDVSVKRAVWQTAAAELAAVAGWFILKRLRGAAHPASRNLPMTRPRFRFGLRTPLVVVMATPHAAALTGDKRAGHGGG